MMIPRTSTIGTAGERPRNAMQCKSMISKSDGRLAQFATTNTPALAPPEQPAQLQRQLVPPPPPPSVYPFIHPFVRSQLVASPRRKPNRKRGRHRGGMGRPRNGCLICCVCVWVGIAYINGDQSKFIYAPGTVSLWLFVLDRCVV